MTTNHIIVTTDSFHSQNKHDLVASNSHYITKLFQNNLEEDKISESALQSYYVDYYHSHIIHGGFYDFIEAFKESHKILYYIRSGLKALKSTKHLKLFNAVFPEKEEKRKTYDTQRVDLLFKKIQQQENLLEMNYQWLLTHPQLVIIHRDAIDTQIQQHITNAKNEKRHIKIIKQLCKIIDEEFIGITAGDTNNIYNRAWHFKTAKNYYYIIEKNHIVTLYNSFTKQEVTKGRLVANKTEQSLVSNFIAQMLA